MNYPQRSMLSTARTSLCAGLAAALFWLGLAVAHAQAGSTRPPSIYNCRTADGRVISSDRPIADCAQRELRELNQDGSVRRIIAAPQTPEQRRAAAEETRQRQAEELARRIQQARDRNLLLTFEDESALDALRERGLAEIDHEIRIATLRILAIDKELQQAQHEAEAWTRQSKGKPLPFAHQKRITDAANAILAENALIEERTAERNRLEARFESDRNRLRELLGRRTAQPRG